MGVDQTYTIVFDSFTVEQNKFDAKLECDRFLAYVKVVNGAGESDPSNTM